jgi:hypothetical protein
MGTTMPSPEHVRLRLMLLGQRRDVVGHRCATDSLRHTPSQWDRKEQLRGVSDSEEEAISRPHPYMGYVRLGCQLKPGDRRFCWSRADLWAWLDLDQRPHPYQLNAGNRCADRPFPGHLRPSGPKVCVQSAHWYAFIHSTPPLVALPLPRPHIRLATLLSNARENVANTPSHSPPLTGTRPPWHRSVS